MLKRKVLIFFFEEKGVQKEVCGKVMCHLCVLGWPGDNELYRSSSSCVECITDQENNNGKKAGASESSNNSSLNTTTSSATAKAKAPKKVTKNTKGAAPNEKATKKVPNCNTGQKKKNSRLTASKGFRTAGIRSSRRNAKR